MIEIMQKDLLGGLPVLVVLDSPAGIRVTVHAVLNCRAGKIIRILGKIVLARLFGNTMAVSKLVHAAWATTFARALESRAIITHRGNKNDYFQIRAKPKPGEMAAESFIQSDKGITIARAIPES